MSEVIDWEERKQSLWNRDNLRRKIAHLFPKEKADELEEVLWNAWQGNNARLGLGILRCCDVSGHAGDREHLDRVIKVAKEDYRDILILEYLGEVELPFEATEEQKQIAREDDAREYLDWLIW